MSDCSSDVGSSDIVDRAASNAPAPAVAQTPFHRTLLGVAISAHQLHSIARDFAIDRIGEAFRGRAVENGGRSEEGGGGKEGFDMCKAEWMPRAINNVIVGVAYIKYDIPV